MTTATEPIQVIIEQAKPLKLSEAMRLGEMHSPQAFGSFRDGPALCALATAADVLDVKTSHLLDAIRRKPTVAIPCGHGKGYDIVDSVIHLNDEHRMPRREIADWLEQNGL